MSYWYILCHPSPSQADWLLHRENLGDFRREGDPVPEPLEYFIPFQFLLRAPTSAAPASVADDYADRVVSDLQACEDNGVREALHSYIFIKADEGRITKLLDSEWNRGGRLHMHLCRTLSGEPLRVKDDEMRRFIDTLSNRQLRYYIGQPLSVIEVGDTVTLHIAPWEGRKATITQLESRGGRSKLTVTIDILGNLTRVTFPDVHEGDVTFDDETLERLVTGNLLSNFEQEMISVLGLRFGRNSADVEDRRHTQSRLARMYSYRAVLFDSDDDQRRFTALMLICASLLGEKDAKQNYVSQIEEWLGGRNEADDATDAYLLLALFVTLRDPSLRESVKAYKNGHDDCPEVIRQLFARVKRLRCR